VVVWGTLALGVLALYCSAYALVSSPFLLQVSKPGSARLSLGTLADPGALLAMAFFTVTGGMWAVLTFLYWRMFERAFVVSRTREQAALNPHR
jgi:hypothetical protein